jgi:DNA-binding SARP family transcriptional activator
MMRFRLLGPLEVRAGEEWRGIGAPKWRSVLATLLINAGQIVPADVLISEVWGDAPPAKAGNLISIYVLRLRRLMGDADSTLLVTRAPGYQLRIAAGDSDAQLFETLVDEGRRALAAGDPATAASQLAEALALWRGSPLADVPATPLVETAAERLEDLRLDAAELRITAELDCGNHPQVIPELRRLLADHSLREGLWLLLMRALEGAGRHAEALDAYGHARTAISEELGVDPGPELRQAYAGMLAKDTSEAPGSISAGTVAASARPAEPVATTAAFVAQVPAQLPTDVADFTGRSDQVKHLSDVLASAGADDDSGAVRIALVAGSGGLGKTSLAVHAAHRVRASFPDGQLYVDLLGATAHPLLPADVLARFLRDLGVSGRDIPADDDERAARYRTVLAGRRVLVVLDNARDAAQVRPLLPGTASCAVLITTRSRMPDLASSQLVDLNVLDDDEALVMFTKVVGDERVTAEPEATAELLLACAGLPLAIRICAARLATRPGWTIRAMAGRLSNEHRRLDEMRVGDLAVRASFQVSFTSLPAAAQPGDIAPADAFRLLGLWHGPSISSAAAAALFGTAEYLAEDALELLVDAHLLEAAESGRYKFHDLLRVYASERAVADLSGSDRDAAVGRLLGWYMHAADAAAEVISPHRYKLQLQPDEADCPPPRFIGVDDALGWYDSERVNVVAATRQASACGLHEVAWRLPAPLFTMFNRRGNWTDCIATHRIALESARQVNNRQGEAWVLNNLGEALGFTRESEGIGYLEEALAIRREIGDRIGEGQTANNLADAYANLGRMDEALDLLARVLDLTREVGYRYGEGVALINMGEALLDLDRPQEAADRLLAARRTFTEINVPHGVAYALHNLGRSYLRLGHNADALDCLEQALVIHRAEGDRHREAFTLRFLGSAQARVGLVAEADESWRLAAAILDELGDTAQAAEVRTEQAVSGNSADSR